jgi:Eco57I restriction-modification methylase/restriction endonuclease TaqI-like protein
MLEVHQAGELYLRSLPGETRRHEGRVYTPPHLVRFLLEQASKDKPLFEDEPVAILDPACGAGAILSGLVEELAWRFRQNGVNLAGRKGRLDFLRAVERQIYGVDLDPRACELSGDAVRATVARFTLRPVRDDFFACNVLNADFLLSEEVRGLGEKVGGFEYIIGNPPYVSTTRLSGLYKRALRLQFETSDGRLDLYTLFMERSIWLLSSGGRLVFITPDKFLISKTSSSLRSHLLTETRIRSIARFRSHRVFENAATVPCVTVLERSSERGSVEILSCQSAESAPGEVTVQDRHFLLQSSLGRGAWQLLPAADQKILQRIRGDHATLDQISVRISAGPATGRDGAFIVKSHAADGLEPELLRPAIRGRDILPYQLTDSGLRIIVPYLYGTSGSASLVELSHFPAVKSWLEARRAELESRHCVREWQKQWYDLHDQVSCDLACRVKILVPDVAMGNRFAVDVGGFFPLHSAYYIMLNDGVDPYYVTAVLNSRICEYLIRVHAPRVKDGFLRYRQQFLSQLPVPRGERSLRRKIISASREADAAAAEELVCRLFGLSDRMLAAVDRALALSRDDRG